MAAVPFRRAWVSADISYFAVFGAATFVAFEELSFITGATSV